MSTPKPLGYWLKHIDRGIEQNFTTLLGTEGIVRRSWQLLHTLAVTGPRTLPELDRAVAPFLDESDPTVVPYLEPLITKGWVAFDNDVYALTPAGHPAHDALFARIGTQREAIIEGLTPDDYETLIALLRRIADNVDALPTN
ncbi:MarR family winged helix-turn-helix transcriptional regulator [Nocardia pseudobrasiliensis]|uniref:DNA-binding MarR family transcriptional regulator n=1 Tax=Nocardia pseudobrasiliensis TaxID=45979 RepID=A0A370IEQ2_9NOCA|nr:hypothetical protein [Nocardia pseudobrasiliensis]RDI69207.1 hypothetical protein DFR76_101745 [Nocardia pseudobrasiliensis]